MMRLAWLAIVTFLLVKFGSVAFALAILWTLSRGVVQ